MHRFGRDTSRNSLFSNYDAASNRSASPSKNKGSRPSSGYGYGYTPPQSTENLSTNGPAFGAYPGANGAVGQGQAGFRPATPNSRGQYSAAVLDELESQNDEQVGVLSGKVKELKNVRP
jgi:blocked-early-in-transport protein 1